ncbi:MAG: helix-turn-helix domain-containing protein [Woeseiaceae bacterium]|nr:helix-turn-helix domain-containing protein [Woeseiaceae bacterium]
MRTTQFVESYFDAWNHCDSQAVADHLTSDGIYCDVPQNEQCTHDELVTFLNDFFSKHHHRYELIGEILTGKDTIAFQYKVFPQGEIVENPSPTAYRGAEFMTLHGDAAMTITDYYDIPGTGRDSTPGQMTSREMQARKYAKSGLSDEQMHCYKAQLVAIMQSQKLYLNPDLTLPRLAKSVNCSVNHLSQVLNSGFGMSFFDYLNQFRIDHAKQLLARRDDRKSAILNIAFAVGFNSNSAFYAAFKKRVGQTPAQYRRHLLTRLNGQ